ncbi:MAG: Fur family transcriptional regulator [Pseudomonadota bacterium]
MGIKGEKLQAQALALLKAANAPLSAYDILAELKTEYPKIAPTTIYRTLNALTSQGQVHRLESLNAYMACQHDTHDHESVLSICDDCGSVEENVAPEVMENLSAVIGKTGFAPTRSVVEVHGTCADCGPGAKTT